MVAAIAAFQIALASGRVNGHAVLGSGIEVVEASFGRPVSVEHYAVRVDLRYRGLEVIFSDGRRASALLATGTASPAVLRQRLSHSGSARIAALPVRPPRLLRHVLLERRSPASDLRAESRPSVPGHPDLAAAPISWL
jgi:hypothetical protein